MSTIERLTITMPAEMAATVRAAVDRGAYASTSEIVREALRDWERKQVEEEQSFSLLRSTISEGDKGEGIPAEEVFAEMRAIVAERRAARQ